MVTCNRRVRCWDLNFRECKRELGHALGCNPFSDSPPLLGVVSNKQPSKSILDMFRSAKVAAGLEKKTQSSVKSWYNKNEADIKSKVFRRL